MLTAALDYFEREFSVVPAHWPTADGCSCAKGPACGSPGKHPWLAWREFQERRATGDEVRDWWNRRPASNVAIVTGTISRLAVFDVDVRSGGLATLAELDADGHTMPFDNPLAETGTRGLHHYSELSAPLAKAAPYQGIELQADGGLVVAPPSLHKSGRRYRWLRDLDAPLAPLPSWLREAATPKYSAPPAVPIPDAADDEVLAALRVAGLYLGRHRRAGLHRVRCPWSNTHSNQDVEAVVLEPGASVAPGWAFKCLHAHCAGRRIGELLDVLRILRRRAA
jgi:hypothetical protein